MDNLPIRYESYQGQLTTPQVNALFGATPKEFIKYRQGRGGKNFKYVPVGYVTNKLNEVFGLGWSFKADMVGDMTLISKTGQLVVKGSLFVKLPSGFEVIKEQYGSAEVKLHSNGDKEGRPVDIGDDFKAAASDALKKCASLLGVAADVYFLDWETYDTKEARTEIATETIKSDTPKMEDMVKSVAPEVTVVEKVQKVQEVKVEVSARERAIAEIMSGVKARNISDEILTKTLERVFGKKSLAELDDKQLSQMLAGMNRGSK